MSLIHWWKLDETSGALIDVVGGLNGTATGTQSVPGLFGNARAFANAGDVIKTADDSSLNPTTTPFSIRAVVKMPSSGVSGRVRCCVNKYGSTNWSYIFGRMYGSDHGTYPNKLLFGVQGSPANVMIYTKNSYIDGQIHDLVMTCNPAARTVRVYIDAALEEEVTTGPSTVYTTPDLLAFGNYSNSWDERWDSGFVDNVMFFNHELSAAEVNDLYYPASANLITLTNLDPAAYSHRNPMTTAIEFSIECGIDIKPTFTIEVDETGTNTWVTAYNGTSWVGPYSGTIGGTATKIDVAITSRTYPTNTPVYLRVTAENVDDEEYVNGYWFRTILLDDYIVPRYPVHEEQMVPTSTELAIDFRSEDPATVTVNGTLAYDDSLSPKFRNGWTGSYLDDDQGQRLLLIPPAALTINTAYTVAVTTSGHSLTYWFRVGSEQVTTTNDALMPRLTEATASKAWLGYIRNGKLYLRHANPLGGVVEVVPTEHFEHGYDPTLGKYVLYWVDRGKIYYATADPADAPETLVQPNEANAEVRVAAGSDRPQVLEWEREVLATPHVRGVPPDGLLIVDILRPTGDPEASAIVAVHFYKFIAGTFTKIAEVPVIAGQSIISFEDPSYTPGAEYAAVPVYNIGQNLVEGPMSPRTLPPDYSGTASVGVGSDRPHVLTSRYFAPAVYFFPDDARVAPGSDKPGVLTFRIFEVVVYLPDIETAKVAAGDDHPGTLKGTGFGIIGVG